MRALGRKIFIAGFAAALLPLTPPMTSTVWAENVYEYDSGLPIDGAPIPKLKPGAKAASTTQSKPTIQAIAGVPTPQRKPSSGKSAATLTSAKTEAPSALRGWTLKFSTLAFPTPLSGNDVKAYRDAFAANKRGDWAAAMAALGRTDSPLLRGHVLAKRYRNLDYSASGHELEAWLNSYSDHPDAPRLARLARV